MNQKITQYYKFVQMTVILVIYLLAGTAFGQSPSKVKPDDRVQTFSSKLMKREMHYRVILPAEYSKNKDARYPVVYFLHGAGGKYKSSFSSPKILEYFRQHNFIYVVPEGNLGFYSDSVSAPNDKYESYFVKEVIAEVDKNFRTIADRSSRIVAGISMGGYGAIKFGVKYPEMFSLVGSFAGAGGVSRATEKNFGALGKVIDSIFGPLGSENRNSNNLFKIVGEMSPEKVNEMPMIYQSCGTEDFLIDFNREFFALLNKKKMKHEYRELPGAHNSAFFEPQVGEFLNVAERHLKVK